MQDYNNGAKVLSAIDEINLKDLIKPVPVFVLRRSLEALEYGAPTLGQILTYHTELTSFIKGHTLVAGNADEPDMEVVCIEDPSPVLATFRQGFLTHGKFVVWEGFELEDINDSNNEGATSRKELVDSLMEKVQGLDT